MIQDTMNEIQSLEVEQTEKYTHSFLQEVYYTMRSQIVYQVIIERDGYNGQILFHLDSFHTITN